MIVTVFTQNVFGQGFKWKSMVILLNKWTFSCESCQYFSGFCECGVLLFSKFFYIVTRLLFFLNGCVHLLWIGILCIGMRTEDLGNCGDHLFNPYTQIGCDGKWATLGRVKSEWIYSVSRTIALERRVDASGNPLNDTVDFSVLLAIDPKLGGIRLWKCEAEIIICLTKQNGKLCAFRSQVSYIFWTFSAP